MLKQTLILSTLFFLIIAPTPDSRDIAEMTANFLVPAGHTVLSISKTNAIFTYDSKYQTVILT